MSTNDATPALCVDCTDLFLESSRSWKVGDQRANWLSQVNLFHLPLLQSKYDLKKAQAILSYYYSPNFGKPLHY